MRHLKSILLLALIIMCAAVVVQRCNSRIAMIVVNAVIQQQEAKSFLMSHQDSVRGSGE